MRNCVLTTFLLTVLPGLLLAQQPGISKDTNFYSGTPGLQARVARFTAQPATSKAGQAVRLEWLVENPVGPAPIEPGIGAVQARGSKEVNPRQTTAYVLTVRGPRDQMLTQEVTATIPGTVPLKPVTPVRRGKFPRCKRREAEPLRSLQHDLPGQFLPGRRSHEHFQHAWSARNHAGVEGRCGEV